MLRMSPMTLWEVGAPTGDVALKDLLDGRPARGRADLGAGTSTSSSTSSWNGPRAHGQELRSRSAPTRSITRPPVSDDSLTLGSPGHRQPSL